MSVYLQTLRQAQTVDVCVLAPNTWSVSFVRLEAERGMMGLLLCVCSRSWLKYADAGFFEKFSLYPQWTDEMSLPFKCEVK